MAKNVNTTRQAFVIAWLIVSAMLLLILLSAAVAPVDAILRVSAALQLPHGEYGTCPVCGMTEAFIATKRGQFGAALDANSGSLVLYGMLLANELAAAAWLLSRKARRSLKAALAGHSRNGGSNAVG